MGAGCLAMVVLWFCQSHAAKLQDEGLEKRNPNFNGRANIEVGIWHGTSIQIRKGGRHECRYVQFSATLVQRPVACVRGRDRFRHLDGSDQPEKSPRECCRFGRRTGRNISRLLNKTVGLVDTKRMLPRYLWMLITQNGKAQTLPNSKRTPPEFRPDAGQWPAPRHSSAGASFRPSTPRPRPTSSTGLPSAPGRSPSSSC